MIKNPWFLTMYEIINIRSFSAFGNFKGLFSHSMMMIMITMMIIVTMMILMMGMIIMMMIMSMMIMIMMMKCILCYNQCYSAQINRVFGMFLINSHVYHTIISVIAHKLQ